MQLGDKAQILRNSPVFSHLNEDELGEVAGLAVERSFVPNESVFWEGDTPEWCYIIDEGRVKVFKNSSSGKEVIISFFGPGEVFGEVAVFENEPYPASAQATIETRVVAIKRENCLYFLSNHPQTALRIINVLSERLRDAQTRLRGLAGERVEQRLAGLLLMLSAKLGSTLPFTRQEIADMVGTTTETAIRVMSQLKDRGIIRSTRGKVIIINQEKLRLLSEGPPNV